MKNSITRDFVHSPFTPLSTLIRHLKYFCILFDWLLPTCQNKSQGPGKRTSSSLCCYYLFEDYIAYLANEAAEININQLTGIYLIETKEMTMRTKCQPSSLMFDKHTACGYKMTGKLSTAFMDKICKLIQLFVSLTRAVGILHE